MFGIPTFLAAAIAVSNLNASAFRLGYVEQSRDKTVAVAGVVVFMGLLTMLTELVAVVMRLCTKDSLSVHMVSCPSYHFSPSEAMAYMVLHALHNI